MNERAELPRCRTISAILLVLSALVVPAAVAHHSAAMYEKDKTVTIDGTVTRYLWANPHVYIYVEQQRDGQRIEWEVEGGPPSVMHRLGWSASTLQSGAPITIVGHPAKGPARKVLKPTAIRYAGRTLFDTKNVVAELSTSDSVASRPAQGLSGVWVTLYDKSLDERLDADKLTLTDKGRAAYKRFDEKKMLPAARCVAYTAPFFMTSPDLKRITQTGQLITIDSEFDGAQRTVYLDQTTHEGAATSNQGHSIGHWEGQSLVIDTTRFSDNLVGNTFGLPSGSRKHLIERLTPASDGKSLTYHFELADPEYISAPVSGDVQWVFRPDTLYSAEKCNPEVARKFSHD